MYHEEDVQKILEYKELGFSIRETAIFLPYSRSYITMHWNDDPGHLLIPQYHREHSYKLDKYKEDVDVAYELSGGNCNVILQELKNKHPDLKITQRTIANYTRDRREEDAVNRMLRRPLRRIETPAGAFLQIDFGQINIIIGGLPTVVHFFIATLAYSRRIFVKVTVNETMTQWLHSLEEALHYFGGRPLQIVCDNARALVYKSASRGGKSRECHFSKMFLAFCRYWGMDAVACYPHYPQSKGKVECMVGFVKKNCIAKRTFDSLEDLQRHIAKWTFEVADQREMRLADGEERVPARRFEKEARLLRAMDKPPFFSFREETRTVDRFGILTVDTKQYQLPFKLAKKEVTVLVKEHSLQVFRGDFKMTLRIVEDEKKVERTGPRPVFGSRDPALGVDVSLVRSLDCYEDFMETF